MLDPGERIDIWVVEKALGAGGMGSVYRCHNRKAKRILAAVKVLETSLRRMPGAEERFIREAEILFSLDHPNIVKVRNVRTDVDPPYLEMEFVRGQSLEGMLRRGALSYTDAIGLMRQMTDAIAYLHDRGVRHRDIKPANLLAQDDGTLKLVDFGLAMEAGQTRLTQSNTTFGTVSYAPPEWITPESMDPEKWDIYASGVVFWEMLRGQVAFPVSGKGSPRQQAMQVIIAKQGHAPLDPGADFHDDVRDVIRSMTHSDPERRPQHMRVARDQVADLRPEVKRLTGATIAPLADLRAGTSTWHDDDYTDTPPPPMRDEWARALASTPVPIAPRAPDEGERSELDTVITHNSLLPFGRGRPLALMVGLGLGVAAALALGAVAVGVAMQQGVQPVITPTTARQVDVAVSWASGEVGLSPSEVGVKIGDAAARKQVSFLYRFDEVPLGDTTVSWVIGPDCPLDTCPAECPSWCGTGTQPLVVARGDGIQTVELELPAPIHREVVVQTPVEGDWPVSVLLGDTTRVARDGAARFATVRPGRYPLRVDVGRCDVAHQGCHPDGECPAGCVSWQGTAEVAWDQAPLSLTAEIVAPKKSMAAVSARPAPATKPAPAPQPAPAPAPQPGRAGVVTFAQFATWLADNPEWQRDAAIALGRADDEYLRDWEGVEPPSGRGHHGVTHISWYAASAYCAGRGGLAEVDAEPTSWTESSMQPSLEWRTEGGRAAFRDSTGTASDQVDKSAANGWAGFRCAR